jgi:chromatin segregation and condensation protein Rec8/ScpA/Scc1 (kleisin family)
MHTWKYKINLADVFHNDDMTFEDRRGAIVRRIRASSWFKEYDEYYDELPQFVEELADTRDTEEFDNVWDAIYNIADYDRVRIQTV